MKLDIAECGYRYRGRVALSDINSNIDRFPCALLGANGSGKSTLCSLIAGRWRPSSGHVQLVSPDGTVHERCTELRRRVAFLPQEVHPVRRLSAIEQVMFGGWLKGMKFADLESAARQSLEDVEMVEHLHAPGVSLSGGQLRRICIAQAIVTGPEVLVLDEPMSGIDTRQQKTVWAMLSRLSATTNVIMSTHVLNAPDDFFASVLLLDSGRVLFSGPVSEFIKLSNDSGEASTLSSAYSQWMDAP